MELKERKIEQVLGLHIQRRNHGKGTHQRNSEESKQGSEMCFGNIGERKWGGDFGRRMMMFKSMIESKYIDVRSRDLGMEGTRRGRESARKIFERGARSGERKARLPGERRVQEE
jgi:hypothetical protein